MMNEIDYNTGENKNGVLRV